MPSDGGHGCPPGHAMLPDSRWDAEVILVSPAVRAVGDGLGPGAKTFRERNTATYAEQLDGNSFQTGYIRRMNEALGIESLAAQLRSAGIRAAVLNCALVDASAQEIARKVRRSGAAVVGISLMYSSQLAEAAGLLEALQADAGLVRVAGGALASSAMRSLLVHLPGLDAVVYGEAEDTFVKMAQAVLAGRDFRRERGLAYRNGREIVVTPPAAPVVLDDIERPDRNSLAYLRMTHREARVASLYTSRGCMGRCTFCNGKDAYNAPGRRTYRSREPGSVVDEIEYLHRDFGVRWIYINDDNFLGYGKAGRERVQELASLLIDKQLPVRFAVECRVDALDRETLQMLARAGMSTVLLGIESGSDAALRRWRKGTTSAQNEAALRLLRELKIQVEPSLILVDPHTSAEELEETVSFIDRTHMTDTAFPLNLVNRLRVLPGSDIERTLVEEGILRARESERSVGEAGGLPAILKEFAQLDYRCVDGRIEAIWTELRAAIEPLEQAVEVDMLEASSRITEVLAQSRGGGSREKAVPLVRAMAAWRRGLGDLTLSLLRLCVEGSRAPEGERQATRLKETLENATRRYCLDTLGRPVPEFLEEVRGLPRASGA